MSDTPVVRPASADDAARVRAVAERSTTASYDLSPRERDELVGAVFGETAQRRARDASDTVLFVAEVDGEVAGVAVGSRAAPDGTVRWLHVDPDHRGRGVGTALFERARDAVAEYAPDGPRLSVLAANREGAGFAERVGFERVEEREREFDGLTVRERLYGPEGSGGGPTERGREDASVPDTATTDGETVYLGEERVPGTEGPMVPTYVDADRSEAHGFFCANCDSTDVVADAMETVECTDCGNVHRPEEYDGAYL